jgi:GNAT superfamily N-acetyltransferase
MDIAITKITSTRVPELLKLIRELAKFERLEHEVKTTVKSLRQAFFSPQPAAGALLANYDGKLAGYAIYFFTFSSFVGRAGIWLEDVYVRPKYRLRGVGSALIQTVAQIGVERNCGRFEWTALNWNKKALDFYDNLGARVMDEWLLLRLDAAGLRRVAALATTTKGAPKRSAAAEHKTRRTKRKP